jgi:hypothetical protein
MQLYRAVYLKIVHRVSLPKWSEAFKPVERQAKLRALDSSAAHLSTSDSLHGWWIQIFFWKWLYRDAAVLS